MVDNKKAKRNMMDKIVRRIKNAESIVIYGAGTIGMLVLNRLKEMECFSKVRFFAESTKGKSYKVEEIEVISIENVQECCRDALIIVAVGEKLLPELMGNLRRLGLKRYIIGVNLLKDSYNISPVKKRMRNIRNKLYLKWQEGVHAFGKNNCITISHVSYCLVENVGDTVLSWCVRKYFKNRNVKWNIIAVNRTVDDDMINEINGGEMLLIGGGGLFLPDSNENDISGWQWAISKDLLEKIKVPIVVYSVGYNYFRGQQNSELFVSSLNALIEKADFVGLRNMGSVNAVKSFIRDDLKEKVVYQPCTTTFINKYYRMHVKKKSKYVAFNMAFDRDDRRYGDNKDNILSQVAKAAKRIEEMGYRIVYVAHTDGDLRFLPYLQKEGVSYIKKNMTQSLPYEVIKLYGRMNTVIGMRGHAQMIPFGIGTKIISLGTHDKMKWFLEDVKMVDCYRDITENVQRIAEDIVDIFIKNNHNQENDIYERMNEGRNHMWDISEKNKTLIEELWG